MHALFEITEVSQPWRPPFEKTVSSKEFQVQTSEGFDSTADSKEPVFKLVQILGDKALIEYRRDYTPKGYEQPQARQFWFKIGETREFSHLWGENGTTKKLTFKGMNGNSSALNEPLAATEQAETENPGELPKTQSKIVEA